MAGQLLPGEPVSNPPYRPLSEGQIRVIELKPGVPGTHLQADLHHVPLRAYAAAEQVDVPDPAQATLPEAPPFEAISYCWGDLTLAQSLSIGDESHLTITKSLYAALQSFRYPDRPRYLWADAVCINQTDTAERSAQVAMMGDIYATASFVLVWLGPALPEGTETLAFTILTAPVQSQGDRSRSELLQLLETHLEGSHSCGCCGAAISAPKPLVLADALAAVAKLLERPYFTRLWCVQEVALAQRIQVYCGTHNTPWEIFTTIVRVPGQFEDDQEDQDDELHSTAPRSELRQVWARCSYLNQLRARIRSQKKGSDPFRPTALCKDLLMMSALKCQDPLDRIFGVSKVLGLQIFHSLRADYSISAGELYRRTVEAFLGAPVNRSGGRAAIILGLAGTEIPMRFERPSWVPNLQCLSERSRAKYTFYQWAFQDLQNTSDIVDFQSRVSSHDPTELLVKGTQFAKVEVILEHSDCPSKHVHRRTGAKCPVEEGVALIEWYRRCRSFLETRANERYGPAVLDSNKAIHQCFSLSHATERVALHTNLHRKTIVEWVTNLPMDDPTSFKDPDVLMQDLKSYITGCPHDRDRNLCIVSGIKGNRASWIPPQALPGDSVCHLSGAPYPFVVREGDDGTCSLIGDAFVEGMTEPEALGLDLRRWTELLAEYRKRDSDLRQWMKSSTRTALRQEAISTLKAEDQKRKESCRATVEIIKSMYREADDTLSWVRLR